MNFIQSKSIALMWSCEKRNLDKKRVWEREREWLFSFFQGITHQTKVINKINPP